MTTLRPTLFAAVVVFSHVIALADSPRNYVWLEADEFRGIQLDAQFAVGYPMALDKHTNWISRMGIFPDTTQGAGTKILTLDAHPERTVNTCFREIEVPAAGKYRVWVRYSDWRNKTEFFKVKIEQANKAAVDHEFGGKPVISESDEMKLRVDFAYVWDSADVTLEAGAAKITLYTDKIAEAHRDVDVILLTDDLYTPRERGILTPAYGAYLDQWMQKREPLKPLLPPSDKFSVPEAWKIKKIAGRDFWFTGMQLDVTVEELNSPDWPNNIYMKRTDSTSPPIMSDPDTAIWTRLGSETWPVVLTQQSRFGQWLKNSKRAFWIEGTWPRFHHPKPDVDYLKAFNDIKSYYGEQFLGFYLLEGPFLPMSQLPPTATRDQAFEATKKFVLDNERTGCFGVIFGKDVGSMVGEYFPTPSFTSTFMSAPFFELGNTFVGNELGDEASDTALRQAFNRGAARQYGGKWGTHYGAFGYDPPNDTTMGYGDWLAGRSGDVYGGSVSIVRRTAYIAWLSGQNAHHFEDIPSIFWKHWHHADKQSLNPRGEAVLEFLTTIRKHDRGVPYTPIAFLMDKAHGWTNTSLTPYRIWNNLPPAPADYAVDQHFESLAWPIRRDMAIINNDEQVQIAQSIIGDTYDVLVTADTHADAVDDYRVIWLVGDTRLNPAWIKKLRAYVEAGGTLVANVEQARGVLDESLLGAKLTGQWGHDTTARCNLDGETQTSSEFDFERVQPTTAKPLARSGGGEPLILENAVGKGRVILTTPRWMMTRDGWSLPLQPHLLLHTASGLTPIEVRGNVEYCINKTDKGWLVGLINNRGVYKMAHAQATVHREDDTPVEVFYRGKLHTKLIVDAGDVQLVEINASN